MIVEPFIKIGDLLFDDHKEQIRKKLNQKFEQGVKEFGALKECYDYFPYMELFVYYDKNDKVNAFEFFKSTPIFNNIDLLNVPYNELLSFFSNPDQDIENNYNEFTSNEYGIGGNTSDDPDDKNSFPASIIIFRKGYYESFK